jgi:sodium/bile acid cotransporter 7
MILGYYFPEIAKIINKKDRFFNFLIIFLFFIQGFVLQKEKIFSGIKNIKLHIVLFFFTFIFFPFYFWIFVKILPFIENEGVIAGLFVLACLPTTIASSAIYVNMARGNVGGAIFNAVFSNMLGVFVSPLLFSFMLKTSVLALPLSMLSDIFMSLIIRIIIPMALGMILRNFAINFIENNKKKFSIASNTAILFIVFRAFAKSADAITSELILNLYPVFIFLALSYLVLSFIAYKVTRLIGFSYDDVITTTFIGAQKTLGMGAPLITLYFKDNPQLLGIILIPLLFYHSWQLFAAGFIVKYFLKKKGL